MPITIADSFTDPASLKQVPQKYLIFYSNIVGSKMWCPDCLAIDDLVQQTFSPEDAPSALIVYVGDKPEWKSPTNVFRGAPWNVSSIPTIIKLQNSEEAGRLVESEIQKESLAAFVRD